MLMVKSSIAATAVAVALTSFAASAEDVKLPNQLSWTAYGTKSSGYAQGVGIGQMLKKNYGTALRIIPGKNDVSRMVPLRSGQSEICACGAAAVFAQEGALMFGSKKWGPMPLLNLFNNLGSNGQQLVVAGDSGIKTAADLKGKRVTFVKGAPALNLNTEAMLAFAGLTWDDVKKVTVPGWGQSAEAVVNGQADATWGSTVSSAYQKLAASPRGLYWLNLPHSDAEGWARARKVAPHWSQSKVEKAVDIEKNESGGKSYEGNNYPYPIYVASPKISDETAYSLTKAVMENYEQIKDSGPGMDGYRLVRQPLKWAFPYHPAAIKYYKEKGVWTADHDTYNDGLLNRQKILADAWAKMDKDLADDAFIAAWQKVRADALDAAGLDVPFRSW